MKLDPTWFCFWRKLTDAFWPMDEYMLELAPAIREDWPKNCFWVVEMLCDFGCWAHPTLQMELSFMKSDLMLQGLHLNWTFRGVMIDIEDILL